MIALARDCLLFRGGNGESLPLSADMISPDMMGENSKFFDYDFLQNTTKAIFHYFKHDLGRQTITLGEFAEAFEKVLGGFLLGANTYRQQKLQGEVLESDLCRLAFESGKGCELFFFSRLRDELRHQLQKSPKVLRLRGLRGAVKCLTGARRWSGRCRKFEDQILAYLRQCLDAETHQPNFSLLVE